MSFYGEATTTSSIPEISAQCYRGVPNGSGCRFHGGVIGMLVGAFRLAITRHNGSQS